MLHSEFDRSEADVVTYSLHVVEMYAYTTSSQIDVAIRKMAITLLEKVEKFTRS